ncbi:MAG: hypothetical protein ABJI09_14400, partial [Marinomonas sp.]
SSDARQAALASALERINLALAAAPNRHFSWTLRAEILRLSQRPVIEIAASLRMSALLGPREASSMLLRVEIIFDLWERLPPDFHQMARQDIQGIWAMAGRRLSVAALYMHQPIAARLQIRKMLIHSAQEERHFNALLREVFRER